jgi:BolA family transcriptional regulator, general stress-responsive regulator
VSLQEAIGDKLRTGLEPTQLWVENESHRHSVPPGSETHFKVVIVSPAFEGMSRIARHRRVHAILAHELAAGVHALSVVAKSPLEWEAAPEVPSSPPCLGGSKGESTVG